MQQSPRVLFKTEHKDIVELMKARKNTYEYQCGVDLFFPEQVSILGAAQEKISLKIRCQPLFDHGYMVCPRSSISRTPLLMCNSIGIIDPDYRGDLIVVVHNSSEEAFVVEKHTSLFQLCHPMLLRLDFDFADVLTTTKRMDGGFGSSGK